MEIFWPNGSKRNAIDEFTKNNEINMPEGPELKIMADYINVNAKEKKFNKIYDVAKGNIPKEFTLADGNFRFESESNGKELVLNVYHDVASFLKWVFYQKGLSCRDNTGRTFWYNPKWIQKCTY